VFSSVARFADAASRAFTVRDVVCERARLGVELSDMAGLLGARLHVVDGRTELEQLALDADVGLSFGFGVIFREVTIGAFAAGIWNVHAGALPDYRGRHPIQWAMLEGAREVGITVHRVDTDIDRGVALCRTSVPRSLLDTVADVEARVLAALPDALVCARQAYIDGRGELIGAGRYLPRIDREFADVDPEKLPAATLFNLFVTQQPYGGVTVQGRRYLRCHFHRPGLTDADGGTVVTCLDGGQLVLFPG
jgi:methionyl-tRNA formyltransferase